MLNSSVSETLMSLWTNFAKTGDPTPDGTVQGFKWKNVVGGEDEYLEIGQETPFMWQDPKEVQRLAFWRDIYKTTDLNLHLKRSHSWTNPINSFN